jgi:hypothetical protein
MENQSCTIDDKRISYKAGWISKVDRSIPLDRVQDINIRKDCCMRMFGVSQIDIQTAGAGGVPGAAEVSLLAPRNAEALRERIMEKRDAVVLKGIHSMGGVDWAPKPSGYTGPVVRGVPTTATTVSMESDIRELKDAVLRIERAIDGGIKVKSI